jgi:hypothetical protein
MKIILSFIFIFFVSCGTIKNNRSSDPDLVFVIDTTYNPMETFYILSDGSIIDGVEFKKRIRDSWNEVFGNLTEEEKELLLLDNFKISIDTLNQK